MKRLAILTAFMAAIAVAGCKEIKVENGEVPEKYLSTAQKYTGTYKGKLDGIPGTVTISFNGNKPVVAYADQYGRDFIEPYCESQVGELRWIRGEKDGSSLKLKTAAFDFDPNRCGNTVQGRELVLDFKESSGKTKVTVSILRTTLWENRCTIDGGNPSAGIPPRERCDNYPVYSYISGTFVR